jgi:hypothetical protein
METEETLYFFQTEYGILGPLTLEDFRWLRILTFNDKTRKRKNERIANETRLSEI